MAANFLHPWTSRTRHGHWLRWWLAALVCAGQCGCVQRRFTVRSNPPGAVVYVDDYEIGTTPVSHDFVYYGTRKIRLVKDGYETLTVLQRFPTPWYQIIGIDFIAENVVPGEIRDERVVDYQLQPQVIVPTEQLLGRAENLRRGSGPPSTIVPAGVITPTVAPMVVPTGVLPPPNAFPPANSVPPQGFSLPPAGPPAARFHPIPVSRLTDLKRLARRQPQPSQGLSRLRRTYSHRRASLRRTPRRPREGTTRRRTIRPGTTRRRKTTRPCIRRRTIKGQQEPCTGRIVKRPVPRTRVRSIAKGRYLIPELGLIASRTSTPGWRAILSVNALTLRMIGLSSLVSCSMLQTAASTCS